MGYNILTAENGLEGFELLKKGQFYLVITDIYMSVMEGNELISKLAEYSELYPVIALSYNIFDIISNPIITVMVTKPTTSLKSGEIVTEALSIKESYSGRQNYL